MSEFLSRVLQLSLCAVLVGACAPEGVDPGMGEKASELASGGFTINPATGWPDAGSTWTRGASTVTGNGAWNVALSLPVDSTVPSISANVIDGSSSVVVMMLVSYVGSSATILAQVTSTGTGAQTLSLSSSHVVTSSESLVLRFTTPGSATAPTIGTIGVGTAPTSGPVPFSAGWRLQWNAGSPVASVHSVQAPAGVQIGLVPLGLKGAAEIYVASAVLDTGTVIMTASHGTGQDFTDRFSIGLQSPLGSGGTENPVVIATAAMVSAAARATPPVSLSVGQPFLYARIVSRFITSNGTSNQTDASLEDAVIRAVGTLTLH